MKTKAPVRTASWSPNRNGCPQRSFRCNLPEWDATGRDVEVRERSYSRRETSTPWRYNRDLPCDRETQAVQGVQSSFQALEQTPPLSSVSRVGSVRLRHA